MMNTIKHRVPCKGAVISAYEWGNKENPTVLFLHGFPDTHDVWSLQIQAMAKHYHVLALDLRGVGESSRNGNPFEYRINNILQDIDSVANQILGETGTFHLVGHDWGSVLGWSYVFHRQYSKRVLSWSSFSGPHLGLMLRTYRRCFLNPVAWFNKVLSVSGEQKYQLAEIIRTFGKYAAVFPPLAAVRFSSSQYVAVNRKLIQYGYPADDASLAQNAHEVKNRFFNTMFLYLTNIPLPPRIPHKHACKVPTQIVIPTQDEFVRPWLLTNYSDYVSKLSFKEIDAKHWVQRTHPEQVTTLITQFLEESGHEIISE